MIQQTRKQFLKRLGLATVSGFALPPLSCLGQLPELHSGAGTPKPRNGTPATVPSYLRGYETLYRANPHAAALMWHRNAKWGLFVHYALESLRGLKASEAVDKKKRYGSAEEYAQLKERFTAKKFDANFITDLALEAQMHYVTFTTRHRGNLYMFRTALSDFTSLNSPARRDLVAELAVQCQKKGLGLFLYCPPDVARTEPQETFDRNRTIVRELLTQYGPVAGIWLDGIGAYYKEPQAYGRINELYAFIRSLQPQCLISFKNGTGTEDFVAPERRMSVRSSPIAEKGWALNAGKWGDICTTMQTVFPGWLYTEGCKHINTDQALALLADAFAQKANLTLNTGPLPDGSVHPDDVATLREAGARIRKHGYPAPALIDRGGPKKLPDQKK